MFFLFARPFTSLEFVEKGVQPLEVPLPKSPVTLQPLFKLLERRGPQGIDAALRVHANINESGFAEDTQVFGDLRLPETQAMGQVTDRPRTAEQKLDDLKPVWLGEGAEGFQHGEFEYASTRLFLSRHILVEEYIS
jgi:hypothetical protein